MEVCTWACVVVCVVPDNGVVGKLEDHAVSLERLHKDGERPARPAWLHARSRCKHLSTMSLASLSYIVVMALCKLNTAS